MADLLITVTVVFYGFVVFCLGIVAYPFNLLINIDVPLILVSKFSFESQIQSTFVSVLDKKENLYKSYLLNRKTRPPLIQMA